MSLADERALLNTLMSERAIPLSQVSKRLHSVKDQLCLSGACTLLIPPGKRSHYLVLRNPAQVEKRLASLAVVDLEEGASVRAQSIQANQDSKRGGRLPYVLLNVLGSEAVPWSCTKCSEPTALPMLEMGFAGLILREPDDEMAWQPHGPVIFVENREAWVTLSARLPDALQGAAVIRYEGWLSKRLIAHIRRWKQAQIWLFADFDPVGFANLKALREQGIDARMLIPEISDQVLKTCMSEAIWNNNLGLIAGVNTWIHHASLAERELWQILCEKGAALEHELIAGLAELHWRV